MGIISKRLRQGGVLSEDEAAAKFPALGEGQGQPIGVPIQIDSGGSNFSSWGFLENLVGGVGNMASGLGTLVGRGAWDSIGEAAELTSFGNYEHDSKMDEMLKAAPGAIAKDYKRRYGQGLDQFMLSTYEDPTSFLGDVTTLLTLGGTGAVKGAQGAAKIPAISDDLARMAGGADDVGRAAKVVDKIIPGKKFQQAGISTSAGEAYPLGGVKTRLNQVTGRVTEEAASTNPFRRVFDDARQLKRVEKVGKLEKEASLLDELLESGDAPNPTQLAARRGQVDQLIRVAREMDTDTMLSVKASKKAADKVSMRMFNESGSRFINDRTDSINNYARINVPLVEKYGADTVLNKYLQFDVHEAPVRADFEDIRQTLSNPEALADKSVSDIAETIRPLMNYADNAQDPIAAEKVRRLVEIVAGEPISRKASNVTDDIAEGMDNIRLVNFRQEAKALMESGYAPEDMFDHLYAAKRLRYAHENGIELDDAPDALELDRVTKEGGFKAPVYYPMPSNLTKKNSDFLMKVKRSGATSSASPRSAKKWTGRNLDAYMRGTSDAFDTNPVEAYSRLAAEWVGYRSTMKLMDRVKENFGVKYPDKASIPDGYVLINPKLNQLVLRKNLDIKDQVTRLLAEGRDETEALTEAVKRVFSGERVEKELAELIDSSGEVFAVPEVVAKNFDEAAKWSLPEKWDTRVRLYFDPAMTAWRTNALYLRPAFYINNVVGNTSFLKLHGASLTRMVRQVDKGWRTKLQKSLDELGVRNDVESGMYDTALTRSTHLGKAAETRTGKIYTKGKESAVGRKASGAAEGARRLSGIFEDAARREAFLTSAERDLAKRGVMKWGSKFTTSQRRLSQIVKYGADNPRSVERWLDEMNDVMNNYQNLSPFERKITKRFLVPFWPFYKHAAKTLISLPVKHPAKAKVLEWIHLVDQDLDTLGPRPDWLADSLMIGEGNDPGESRFLHTRGMNPLAGVNENFLGNLGPVPQISLEQMTGRDTFSGRQFTSKDVYNDPMTGQQFRVDPETGQPELLERRLGGLLAPVAPSLTETLWGLSGPFQTLRNASGDGARYSATGEVIEDEYGNPKYPSDPVQELLKLVGVSTSDYNLSDYQQNLSEAEKRALSVLRQR